MRTCWRAIRYFKAERRLIALLIALIAVAFGISVLQAQPISILVDTVFNGIDRTDFFAKLFAAVLPTSAAGKIVGIGVLILLLKIITDVNNLLLRGMINNAIRYRGLARIRLALYKKLQDLPISFHKSWPQGDLLYRLTTDTQGFFGLLDTVIGAAVACVTLAVLTWLMFERSVPLAIVALSIVPPLLVANWYFTRQIRPRVTNAKQLEADMTTVMQRSLGSIGLIQAFCRQFLHFGHMTKAVRNSNDSYWKLNWTESSYALAVQTLVGLGASAFWIYGGLLAYHDQFVVKNPDGVTFGKIIEFSAYLMMLVDPLTRITGFKTGIQTNSAAANRVFAILDLDNAVDESPQAEALPVKPRTLVLQNVSFAYPQPGGGTVTPALLNIQATITPGQFVAFVGRSGAGKSTLLSLLPRFYDPLAGSVKLDGHDLRDLALADVRRHIAAVQQDSPLFPGTIAENIAFGRPESTEDEIIAAAKAAGGHDFIARLPDGYETTIGENASNLSGGQRQRLALARALLADAPILVLDEPTSAQDPLHAAEILQTLNQIRGSRTIVLVTHDLSLVEEADQILVLDAGRVVESGTHDQLLTRAGAYTEMLHAEPAVVTTSLQIAG